MRPQWRNGQTHHHQKGWRSQFCRCCTMFGPSNYRKRGETYFTNIGRIRASNRTKYDEDFILQSNIIKSNIDSKWNNIWDFSHYKSRLI